LLALLAFACAASCVLAADRLSKNAGSVTSPKPIA
jgi:hypothetical protein